MWTFVTPVNLNRYRSDIYTKRIDHRNIVPLLLAMQKHWNTLGGDKSYNTGNHFKTNHILDSKLFSVGLLSRETSF